MTNGCSYEHNRVEMDWVFIWQSEESLSLRSMTGMIRSETRLHRQHYAVLKKPNQLFGYRCIESPLDYFLLRILKSRLQLSYIYTEYIH